MARPTTKSELVEAADAKFAELLALIESMTETEKNAEFNFSEEFLNKQKVTHWKRDKNLRDILIHLYEWHQLLLNWVNNNQNGESKPFLPEPYNWRTYPKMNIEFWERHQTTPYIEAKELLEKSHLEVMTLIKSFSNEELFTKKYFSWTGTGSLGGNCISSTSSHYDWAIKKIKKHMKEYRKTRA